MTAASTVRVARTGGARPGFGAAGTAGAAPVVALIVAAHEAAASFYAGQLAGVAGAGPRAYLRERGFPPVVARAAGWGYAPPGWTGLVVHLRARGFTGADLVRAGLATRSRRGGVVDLFRDRITIPVLDHAGRPVAFTARAVPRAGAGAGAVRAVAKYLNTPTTAAYTKGAVLHGLAEERAALAAGAAVVLVEGPLDRLAVHLAAPDGAYAPVAPGGTAFTPGQVTALDQVAPLAGRRVLVACDDDPAGRAAARRLFPLLAAVGAWPEQVPLPAGWDPAEAWAADPTGPGARAGERGGLRRALDGAAARPLLLALLRGDVEATRVDPCPQRRVSAVRAGTTLITAAPPGERARHLQVLIDAVETASGVAFTPEARAELGRELHAAGAPAAGRDTSGATGPAGETGTAVRHRPGVGDAGAPVWR